MTDEKIKACIAPCGLCCETCFAHVDGDIRKYSMKLKEKLGRFRNNAGRFEQLLDEPVFSLYPEFEKMLDYFAASHCTGCRNEQCRLFSDCGVRPCHQEKGVDFCHECDDFPCSHTRFDDGLQNAWIAINEKIRKIGIEAWCDEAQNRPRYG